MAWLLQSIRAAFALAVACFAATLGDAVVEGLSNSGLLWRGHYTDNSSADLLPMALVSGLAIALTLSLIIRRRLRCFRSSLRALFSSTARALPPRRVAKLLPAIFLAQLIVLWTMETAEQFAAYGHVLGGSLWLGGPLVVSLLVHAAIAVVTAFGLASFAGGLAEQLVRVVRCLYRLVSRTLQSRALRGVRLAPVATADQLFRSAGLAQRGPPYPAIRS